ncbi:MAG: hypothetical protein AB7F75_03515 [Planctomycetota bacterium]
MKKAVILVTSMLFIAGASLVIYLWQLKGQITQLDNGCEIVEKAMTIEAVKNILGTPTRVNEGNYLSQRLFWNDAIYSNDASEIKIEFIYNIDVIPVPITWSIAFDKDGKVISKHRFD